MFILLYDDLTGMTTMLMNEKVTNTFTGISTYEILFISFMPKLLIDSIINAGNEIMIFEPKDK